MFTKSCQAERLKQNAQCVKHSALSILLFYVTS